MAKLNRGLAALAALLGAAAWFQPSVAGSDLWWHLAAGREIWEQHAVPTTDHFSYTFAGQPWMHHEWLWGTGYWLVYRLAPDAVAWANLSLLFAIFAVALVGRLAPRRLALRRGRRALGCGRDLVLVPRHPPARGDAALRGRRARDSRAALGALAVGAADGAVVQPARRVRVRAGRDRAVRGRADAGGVVRRAAALDRLDALARRGSGASRVSREPVGPANSRVSDRVPRLELAVPRDPRVAAAAVRSRPAPVLGPLLLAAARRRARRGARGARALARRSRGRRPLLRRARDGDQRDGAHLAPLHPAVRDHVGAAGRAAGRRSRRACRSPTPGARGRRPARARAGGRAAALARRRSRSAPAVALDRVRTSIRARP